MNEKVILSVLIPTYNRKEQLSNTLDVLENQTNSNFKIVISDNSSNYNINEILDGRNPSFNNKVKIYRRRQNIGADGNIANLFTMCETKWAWFLSDDDFVKTDAVEKILNEIELSPGVGAFNFSIVKFDQFDHKRIDVNLTDFIDFYYPAHKCLHGDLIYLANKVFNIDLICECIGYMFKYNYTKISTAVLIYKMLEKNIPYCTVNSKIVEYDTHCQQSWDFGDVVLGTRTLMDIPFFLNWEHRKKLLTISAFDWAFAIKSYFNPNKEKHEKYFLDQMYHGLYKYILPFHQKIIFKILSILAKIRCGDVLVNIIVRIKKGLKD